jgi:hypothetical protein
MSKPTIKLPEIPEAEQTPLVQALLRLIVEQQERIEELEAEVKRLKELKGKPKLKPSRMDAETDKAGEGGTEKKPKPGPKRAKTGELEVLKSAEFLLLKSKGQESSWNRFQTNCRRDRNAPLRPSQS